MTQIISAKRHRRFHVDATPHRVLELRWSGLSDVGRRRAANEDSIVAMAGLVAVADGLGGHAAGEVASQAAVTRLADHARSRARHGAILDPAAIADAFVQASDDILLRTAGAIHGSGTTVAGIAVIEHEHAPALYVFNIGDSRVYRWRDGALLQLTVDHSYVQELVDSGQLQPEEAELHPDANVITRALGFGEVPPHDSWIVLPRTGDRYLVCSDGLTREVAHRDIAELLGEGSPHDAAAALVQAALDAGGRDNVTVGVLEVLAAPGAPA